MEGSFESGYWGVLVAKKDQFLKIFLRNERHLFNFILTLVPNYSDAEDLLQETASILWKKFDSFEQGTNFMAWAHKIARYKVSNYYKTKKKQFNLDDDILDALSEAASQSSKLFSERKAALEICLKKLQPMDIKLLRMKYYQRISIPKIAEEMERSPHTLYKRISTIYRLLQACIQKTIVAWEVK